MDGYILYYRMRLLLLYVVPLFFSFFFLSNFQTLKIFIALFSVTVAEDLESWNFVHWWKLDGCIVYSRIKLLLFICPFISSFFFLFNSQPLKMFVSHFSGTVRCTKLKLGTHADSGLYCVYQNQTAAAYVSLYFFIFLSNFQTLKFFVTFFSGTVRHRKLKLNTKMKMGQCILCTGIRLLILIYSIISSFFFFSNFQLLMCLFPVWQL